MFSIDDDELDIDLDDEDFLLAACGIPPSTSTNSNTPTTSAVSNSNSNSNLSFQRTSSLPGKPLDLLTNYSKENKRLQPSFTGNINSSNTGTSCVDTNLNKTFQKFNSKTDRNYDQEHGPPQKKFAPNYLKNSSPSFIGQESGLPLKKFASNSVRNSSPSFAGRKSMNVADNLRENRITTNHNSSSYSLSKPKNQTNKTFNNCTANSLRTKCSSPGTSFIRNNNGNTMSSGVNSKQFQTPDQTNKKQTRNFTPGDQQESHKSNASDLSVVDVTPSRKKSARKFPGPAGLLPKLNSGQSLDELPTKMSPAPPTTKTSPNNIQRPVSSQSQTPSEDEEFCRDPWIGMFKEYKENVPAVMRYSIIQVISEAACQRLKYGKVPSLCVLVKTSAPTETDASIFLKDPTGEIHGTLHKKVLEEYHSELGPGAGLILKQVSVFSPSPRKHYLNITPGNIIHIYPPDPSHISCSQPLASQGTQSSKTNSQERITIDEPEILLETQSSDVKQDRENSPENLENFNDLLEGLDDDDDILDEDLLAMY